MTEGTSGDRAISHSLGDYFERMHYSRGDLIEQSFHESGTVCGFGSAGGECMDMPPAGFVAFVSSQPAPADNGEPFDMKLVSLDVKDRVSMAYVNDLYLGKRLTDYLLFVKGGKNGPS